MIIGLILLAAALQGPSPPARAAEAGCFEKAAFYISAEPRAYWEQHGGLPIFGFPITGMAAEYNADTKQNYPTQ